MTHINGWYDQRWAISGDGKSNASPIETVREVDTLGSLAAICGWWLMA
jgi:hypothetical protein